MSQALAHRGPDAAGHHVTPTGPLCGLGVRRLAVLDIPGGRQPMADFSGQVWLAYNGEVYNHPQLRARLEGRGQAFHTRSDTEVVLAAYLEFGPDFMHELEGMFALALWDQPQQRLLLVRDRIGIKPLFYAQHEERLWFASELKSLLQVPGLRRRLDPASLSHFLSFHYVPPPHTMLEGVSQLPPGHWLAFQQGKVQVREYWAGPRAWIRGSPPRVVTAPDIREALRAAVERELVADVPVGALLSGGLDSGAVVALMAAARGPGIPTFTATFPGHSGQDESGPARLLARHVGARHHEVPLGPEILEELPEVVRLGDEPLGDSTLLAQFAVCRAARQHVTVVLSGVGGDELFGGYLRYRAHAFACRVARLPRWSTRALTRLLLRLEGGEATRWRRLIRHAGKFLAPLELTPERRYLSWNSFLSEAEKERLLSLSPVCGASHDLFLPLFDRVPGRAFEDRAMYLDLKTYLPGDPLVLADRAGMGASLEVRVPLLNDRLVELAAEVPVSSKLRGLSTKWILRKALGNLLPPELLTLPKRGFSVPVGAWLRGPWRGLVDRLLAPEVVRERGLFQPAAVERLIAEQREGPRDRSQEVWSLLSLELWQRIFLDRALESRSGLRWADL